MQDSNQPSALTAWNQLSIGQRFRIVRAAPKEQFKKLTKVYVGIVDLIFAVIIGASLVELGGAALSKGLFTSYVLLVAYGTVVLSWTGYHVSLKDKPYKLPFRFWADLVILFFYLSLVTNYGSLPLELESYVLVFLGYSIWSGLKALEWSGETRRFLIRLIYPAMMSLLLFLAAYAFIPENPVPLDYRPWSVVTAVVIIVVTYRLQPLSRWRKTRSYLGLPEAPPLFLPVVKEAMRARTGEK